MQLTHERSEIFVPDGAALPQALARTTHMAIGAHPDDLEILAIHGILTCLAQPQLWFSGVVMTAGGGSPRQGDYADHTDEQMRALRAAEQKQAAVLGQYAAQVLLGYTSAKVKDRACPGPVEDVARLLQAARPQVVYTHDLCDRHETHVAVALRVIEALRCLPHDERPRQFYGCEVWRSLDWLSRADRVGLDCSARQDLQADLLRVFDSQIGGGKRYDLAVLARRRANATFFTSHQVDAGSGLTLAMDLSPLLIDDTLDPRAYVMDLIQRFTDRVGERLLKLA